MESSGTIAKLREVQVIRGSNPLAPTKCECFLMVCGTGHES